MDAQSFFTFVVVPILLYLVGGAFTAGFVSDRFSYDSDPGMTRAMLTVFWLPALLLTGCYFASRSVMRPVYRAGQKTSDVFDERTKSQRLDKFRDYDRIS